MQISASRLSCRALVHAARRTSTAATHSTAIGDVGAASVKQQQGSANDVPKDDRTYVINSRFFNRNPRCLEQLGIARKRLGWDFQAPLRTYWYKVTFEKSGNHIRAAIVHHRDGEVVSASTREYAIRKHLFSSTDVCAAQSVARVLARRSLQFGIVRAFFDKSETPVEAPEVRKRLEAQGIQVVQSAVQTFHEVLVESGLCLEEAAVREPPEQLGIDYDALSESEKRRLRPSLIEQLRTKVDKDLLSKYPSKMRPLPSEELAKPYRQRLLFNNTTGVLKRRDLLI